MDVGEGEVRLQYDLIDPDDDGDHVPTAIEILGRDGNGTPASPADDDADGTPNYLDADDDDDGIDTVDEEQVSADNDPTNDDADGDGVPEYLDDDPFDGPAGDSDRDGIANGEEIACGLDTDDGVATADEDANGNGDPTDDDADNNGLPDYLDLCEAHRECGVDTADTAGDSDTYRVIAPPPDTCGCAAGPANGALWPLVALVLVRRRRGWRAPERSPRRARWRSGGSMDDGVRAPVDAPGERALISQPAVDGGLRIGVVVPRRADGARIDGSNGGTVAARSAAAAPGDAFRRLDAVLMLLK